MQIITYTNLRGETVTFGPDPPYILEGVRGLGAAPVEQVRSSGIYQQGATLQRLQRDQRPIDIKFHVDGRPALAGMYAYREQLMRILSPQHALNEETLETATLRYRNDHGEWWLHAIPEGPNFERRLQQFMTSCPLTFVCPSPFFRTTGISTLTLSLGEGAFQLPFQFPITLGILQFHGSAVNAGHVNTPPLIMINGSGELPKLVNHTTGAVIELTRPVAFGERLRIDTDPDRTSVTLIGQDGTETSAYGYLDIRSDVSEFFLVPGTNDIEYQPSEANAASRVTLTWSGLLEGV